MENVDTSSGSSLEEDDSKGNLVVLKSSSKRVGRPVGHRQKPYTDLELTTAFNFMLEMCPQNPSGTRFLEKLQKGLMEAGSSERSHSALQTFVGGKLRRAVPELYKRKCRSQHPPTERQNLFLREFMRDTPAWEMEMASLERKRKKKMKMTTGDETAETKERSDGADKVNSTFKPIVFSTPKASSSSSRHEVENLNREEMVNLMRVMMADYFKGFKAEVMKEMREVCGRREEPKETEEGTEECSKEMGPAREDRGQIEVTTEGMGAAREDDIEEMDTAREEDRGQIEETTEGMGAAREDDIEEMDTAREEDRGQTEETTEEMGATREDDREEKDTAREEERQEKDTANGIQREIAEEESVSQGLQQQDTCDTQSSPFRYLLSDSIESSLINLDVEMNRAASFHETPLRARLTTVTVVQVFKVTEGDEDHAPFRVVEKPNGDLDIRHESTIDANWSTKVVVGVNNDSTVNKEKSDVIRGDILSVCGDDAAALSPMAVSKVSKNKRSFQMGEIVANGHTVKTLIKRSDKKQ